MISEFVMKADSVSLVLTNDENIAIEFDMEDEESGGVLGTARIHLSMYQAKELMRELIERLKS